MKPITLFNPRQHQREIFDNLKRFNVLVCHRRFGKTLLCINILIRKALECDKERPRFAYIAPFRVQAKQAAWDYLKAYTKDVPDRVVYESELRVDLPNGARIQLYGADNPDSLRGIYLDGVILDEYAQMPPRLWGEVVRPLLADRQGWSIFIGTPQGHNPFHDLYLDATLGPMDPVSKLRDPDPSWWGSLYKASETGILEESELSQLRRDMTEEEFEQELECSFEAAIRGAYYGKLMAEAEDNNRVLIFPVNPTIPVNTCWDLGMGDDTSIWFYQMIGQEIHWIDYYSSSGESLSHYVEMIRERPGYWETQTITWGEHLLPHDASVREMGTGTSRFETLQSLGLYGLRIVQRQKLEDGINACRNRIPMSYFHKVRCIDGIEGLKQYKRSWDEKRQTFVQAPMHDWASHPADSFRTGCLGMQEVRKAGRRSYDRNWIV